MEALKYSVAMELAKAIKRGLKINLHLVSRTIEHTNCEIQLNFLLLNYSRYGKH